MDHASGRLPSAVNSKTTSAVMPSSSATLRPGVAPSRSVSNMRPPESAPRPISVAEHNMPFDVTPRILRLAMAKPPGSTAPTGASGTTSPMVKFHAPQTMPSGPSPASTVISRTLSAPSIGWMSRTLAQQMSSRPSPMRSMDSTTSPRSSNVALSSATSFGNAA